MPSRVLVRAPGPGIELDVAGELLPPTAIGTLAGIGHVAEADPIALGAMLAGAAHHDRIPHQSESVDLIWVDERPSEEVYSELLARTSATDGHLIVSFTPRRKS